MNATRENELTNFDVLCGRDRASYNNIGNRRFRILINLNLPRYLKCQSRNERSKMILSLTRELCSDTDEQSQSCSAVRFFKRQKATNSLIEIDFKGCREKIGHALRDAASQQNSSAKSKEAISEHKQNEVDESAPIPINYDDSENIHDINLSNIFSTNGFKLSMSSKQSRRLSMLLSQTIIADATQDKKSSMISKFQNDTAPIPFDGTHASGWSGSFLTTLVKEGLSRSSFSDMEPLQV